MIIGVGVDITDLHRWKSILGSASAQRMLHRILTPAEMELAGARPGRTAEFAAGRFAAKEAVVKAFGCGIGKQIGFQDINIVPDPTGRPVCTLSTAAANRLGMAEENIRIHLSLSHSETSAVAYAVIESVS